MTQWETIHDNSSQLSSVRLSEPKNYSTERGEGIFEAVTKSFIYTKPSKSRKEFIKKPENKLKSTLLKLTLLLIVLCLPVLLLWQCHIQENSMCRQVDTTIYVNQVKETLHSQVTQPLASKARQVWVDMTHYSIYAPSRIIQEQYQKHILPIIDPKIEQMKSYWLLCKVEYYAYVNQRIEHSIEETIIEEKVKNTANWILEYIDKNDLIIKAGMEKEEAKEKAQQIVQSITKESYSL